MPPGFISSQFNPVQILPSYFLRSILILFFHFV
jgi:hypothetical protein